MKTSVALLLSGLAAQQVSATWNRQSNPFKSPNYNDNDCSDKQKEGFSWGDLQDGQKDFDYGDFSFKGWTCSNSFGKRDVHTKRTFSSKCIKNKVRKETPATFGCGDKKKDGFSVTDFDVSVEYDTDLTLHYKMPDNSICKQTASCKKEGTTIKNTQCGGAQSVEVYLGNHNQQGREDCEIGFHHIGFDCNPGTGYTPPGPPETPSQPPTSCGGYGQPPCSTAVETKPGSTPPPAESTPVESQPGYTPPIETPPSSITVIISTQAPYTNSSIAVPSPPENTQPAETPSVPSCGSYGQPPCEQLSTETPGSTLVPSETPAPTCGGYGQAPCGPEETPGSTPPAESTPSPSETPSNPSCGGYGQPSCETPGSNTPAPSTFTTSSPQPSNPSYPPGGYTPPDVLPKCMNTWLQINSECKDNTDSSCYCKNPDFTKNVIDCVAAWSSDEEIQKSLQYLLGICASYVPENPGLITNCPSNIPLNPTPTPSPEVPGTTAAPTGPAPSAPAPSAPAPSAPAAPPADVPCTTITYGSTSITVPQVHFTTQTPGAPGANPTEPVGLVPGTQPPSAPAQTTGAPYPLPSTLGTVTAPVGTTGLFPSSPAEFTGAASPVNVELKHALFGAALAFFAL